MNRLSEYQKKRNFKVTSEPSGHEKLGIRSGDFMVHLHSATARHYDLRLQWKGHLLSWAVPKGPSLNPEDKRLAVRTEDHPDAYKSFEGVIPKGEYGAGPSLIWEAGSFTPVGDFDEGLKKGKLEFDLDGVKLQGRFALVLMKTENGRENWLLRKMDDEYARPEVMDSPDWDASVATGRTLEDLLNESEQNDETAGKKKSFVQRKSLKSRTSHRLG